MTGGALLVAGTTSDAGKSTIVAGICRWLHRQGVRVAPFKAQNMSNNSVVVLDGADSDGLRAGEIGRAQALQAAACGLTPSVAFKTWFNRCVGGVFVYVGLRLALSRR